MIKPPTTLPSLAAGGQLLLNAKTGVAQLYCLIKLSELLTKQSSLVVSS